KLDAAPEPRVTIRKSARPRAYDAFGRCTDSLGVLSAWRRRRLRRRSGVCEMPCVWPAMRPPRRAKIWPTPLSRPDPGLLWWGFLLIEQADRDEEGFLLWRNELLQVLLRLGEIVLGLVARVAVGRHELGQLVGAGARVINGFAEILSRLSDGGL